MEKRKLIADVFDVAFYHDDVIAFTSDTLTDANIEVAVNETEVRGGKGNGLIATLHSGRDITITITDPIFKLETLALQLGQDIITGAGVGYTTLEKLAVVLEVADKIITLPKTPKYPAKLKVSLDGVDLIETTDYTLSGTTITITKVGVEVEDIIEVQPYAYDTSATSEKIVIDNKTYAIGGKLVLSTLETDTEEKPTANLFYVFHSAQPSGNFTVNTTSEKEANATEIELKVLKSVTSDEIGYILREPIA